jgi:hypothetical protein
MKKIKKEIKKEIWTNKDWEDWKELFQIPSEMTLWDSIKEEF